jgi:phage FluMu protein Com
MLVELKKCEKCEKLYSFDTSRCGQIILKQGHPDSSIIFLSKCPQCKNINMIELPWLKYGTIDY